MRSGPIPWYKSKGKLQDKLLQSHLSVASLGLVLLCTALFVTWLLSAKAQYLASDTGPTAQASLRVLSGIQSSIAATRGWVALGDPDFRQERKQAWEKEIFPAVQVLQSRLEKQADYFELVGLLNSLEESQWWIEDVAQTPGNNRARYYFTNNIIPISDAILTAMSGMIALVPDASSNSRQITLLNAMMRFRYHFTKSVTALGRFVDAPESPYENTFDIDLYKALNALSEMSILRRQMSAEQRELFQLVRVELTPFEQFGREVIRIRKSGKWNVAQHRLMTEAVPQARQLVKRLTRLSTNYSNKMQGQADQVAAISTTTIPAAVLLIIIMGFSTWIISSRSSRRLTRPIIALSDAAEEMANGSLRHDIIVDGDDEITVLGSAFNHMRHAVQEKTVALEKFTQELEARVRDRTQELAISKELAETTLRSIGDAVITTNRYAIITMMNPVAEKLTGWRFEEVQGKPLSQVFKVVNEESQQSAESPVNRCLVEEEVVLLESNCNLICRDGSQIAVDDSAAPITNPDGLVIGAILVFRDVSKERSLHQKLSYQATHDALTGLVNRLEFERRLESAMSFSRSENRVHAIAFLDLDQFKVVNDTCGHAAGDELLRQITRKISEPIRAHDTLARIGGDEFAILLEDCSIENAIKVCEKIRKDIKNLRFNWDGQSFGVGVSIGLVHADEHSASVAKVLSQADSACYDAKEAGRDRVIVFSEDDEGGNSQGEMQWVSRITEAIDEERFELYVQPINPVEVNEASMRHCEVLLRMLDRDGVIIPPGSFLPAAERYNLIHSIDRMVVARVCDAYRNRVFGDVPAHRQKIAVNLSGSTIGNKEALQYIKEQLSCPDIPPEVFCFEITETAAMGNLGQALHFIRELKSLGCYFALDDFGSGLSSFGYLQNLPVDYVKIDGRFVKDMVDNPIDAAMVSSINEITHLMGKKTVAEFVENQSIIDMLTEMGVDYLQGWGVGKPIPAEQYSALLKADERHGKTQQKSRLTEVE